MEVGGRVNDDICLDGNDLMLFDVVIVGAGLSGTYLSRELRNEGLRTIIVEKSNGVGGRLCTKPLGSNIVDYGCQYINPKNDETKSLAIDLEGLGLLKKKLISKNKEVYIAPFGLKTVPQYLAYGSKVLMNETVRRISLNSSNWKVRTDALELESKLIVFSMPVQQVREILERCDIKNLDLPSAKYSSFYTCTFSSSDHIVEKTIDSKPDMPWICNNTKKGLRNLEDIFTVNFSDSCSDRLIKLPRTDRLSFVENTLKETGFYSVKNIGIHFWKYAYTENQTNQDFFYDRNIKIGIIGDSYSIGKVDGAVKSAKSICNELKEEL